MGDVLQAGLERSIEELTNEHRTWERKPAKIETSGSTTTTWYESTPAEEHVRLLNLEATQLKESDIDLAIDYLRRARALALAIDAVQTTEWHLRLPLFLQQAGRMDEAVDEFEILLAGFDRFGTPNPQTSNLSKEYFRNVYLATVYDKLRLAWKREKNSAKTAEAQAKCELHRAEQQRLWLLLEAERAAAREARRRGG
jgi:hypothetical protein